VACVLLGSLPAAPTIGWSAAGKMGAGHEARDNRILISNSYFPALAAAELGFFEREGLEVSAELIFRSIGL